jgi:predicted phosphodiesterase
MNTESNSFKQVLFVGDIHGNFDVIPNFIKTFELDNCAVFQLGDFGVGFEDEIKEQRRLKYLNDRMKVSNSKLFAIRGNHDDPKYFDGNNMFENLELLKDYSVVNINGWNILGIGGAVSIDRIQRNGYGYHSNGSEGRSWWKDEVVVLDHEKLKDLNDIDIIITHTAPSFCSPILKDNLRMWFNYDPPLENDVNVERQTMTEIYDILKENNNISEWYYGHFHGTHKTERDKTNFYGVNINEVVESRIIIGGV